MGRLRGRRRGGKDDHFPRKDIAGAMFMRGEMEEDVEEDVEEGVLDIDGLHSRSVAARYAAKIEGGLRFRVLRAHGTIHFTESGTSHPRPVLFPRQALVVSHEDSIKSAYLKKEERFARPAKRARDRCPPPIDSFPSLPAQSVRNIIELTIHRDSGKRRWPCGEKAVAREKPE